MRVCLCVWAQLVLHVVTTETVPAHVCVCACYVFVSLPLCRLAKPPVPRLHLWSPGKWLIWKYNHSGQDFISSLSDSLTLSPTLSIALISFTTDKFSVSRSTLAVSLFRSLPRSHQNSQLLSSFFLASSFLLLFNTASLAFPMALYFFLHWVIHLEVLNPAEPKPYLLGEWWSVSHNQSTGVQHRDGDKEKKTHNVSSSAWEVFMKHTIHYP